MIGNDKILVEKLRIWGSPTVPAPPKSLGKFKPVTVPKVTKLRRSPVPQPMVISDRDFQLQEGFATPRNITFSAQCLEAVEEAVVSAAGAEDVVLVEEAQSFLAWMRTMSS